jgi:hypothetical protein
MTPDSIADYVIRILESTAFEQADSDEDNFKMLDAAAGATITKLKQMRKDLADQGLV